MNKKPPLYVLPHGIEVIGEYAPTRKNPYWRVRIRPHRFFPHLRVISGGCYVKRSRVVMASKLGRALSEKEIVHHDNEDRRNDAASNLELTNHADHNRHHHLGLHHTQEKKQQIGESVKLAYKEGRHSKHPNLNFIGRTHTEETKRRISEAHKRGIAEGRIAKRSPPPCRWFKPGHAHSEAALSRMSVAQKRRYERWTPRGPNKGNAAGHAGVNWDADRGKWRVHINVHGKRRYLGQFSDAQEAIAVRVTAEKKYLNQPRN